MASIFVCLFLAKGVVGQKIIPLNSGTRASLRGLSVLNERILWASGSKGQVGVSTDAGETWKWMQIPGFEKVDFRDVEGFDENTAVIMGVGSPGYILRTDDKGKNWTVVYKNEDKRIFLDAMFFWNDRSGIIVGDPMDGRFFILRSFDGGKSWREIDPKNRPIASNGEACFAASGSNIAALSRSEAVFVSGGAQARFFIRDTSIRLPLLQGKESTGANAIASYRNKPYKKAKQLAVVGGDFANDKIDSAVMAISTDGGISWKNPIRSPHGYRSGITWISKKRLIACGTSGVDISQDGGMKWTLLTNDGYHVCSKSKSGNTVYLAGPEGRIARLNW